LYKKIAKHYVFEFEYFDVFVRCGVIPQSTPRSQAFGEKVDRGFPANVQAFDLMVKQALPKC